MVRGYLKCLQSILAGEKLLSNSASRLEAREYRKRLLSDSHDKGLKKFASFEKSALDTRRVNQETVYIPRRNLQSYHRTDPFISEGMMEKINVFEKLKTIAEDLRDKYEHLPQWQDSYTRVLLGSVERALRSEIDDNDFTENQPGVGSLNYLEEMIGIRYKLSLADLEKMSDAKIAKVLLGKDDLLSAIPSRKQKKIPIQTNGSVDMVAVDRLIQARIDQSVPKEGKSKTITITLNID